LKKKWRPSWADQKRSINAALDFMGLPEDIRNKVAPKRPRKPSAVDIDAVHGKLKPPLESVVVAAVAELLAVHPLVLFAVRQNSGAASYEAASGKYAPVYFYKFVRWPESMTITDFWGFMIRPGATEYRPFALEAKRENWTKPTDERERRQQAFITLVRKAGGVAGFVRSADEAQTVLEQ
jgi:hypothetical protein